MTDSDPRDRPWRVELTGPARRDLGRLQPQVAGRIVRALRRLAETGRGDVKKLAARREHSLRVGEWRVLFERDVDRSTIEVTRVRPRGRAYRG